MRRLLALTVRATIPKRTTDQFSNYIPPPPVEGPPPVTQTPPVRWAIQKSLWEWLTGRLKR